jgi:hypothetical protein
MSDFFIGQKNPPLKTDCQKERLNSLYSFHFDSKELHHENEVRISIVLLLDDKKIMKKWVIFVKLFVEIGCT